VCTAFPEREIPTGQVQGRQYLFIFLAGISLLTAIMALFDRLSGVFGLIMAFTILACLLVYDYLSEGSFVKVVLAQMKLQKKIANARSPTCCVSRSVATARPRTWRRPLPWGPMPLG